MKHILLLALLNVFVYSYSRSDYGTGDTGTTGAVFLKLAPGARPAAMGEAYTPLADDIYSIYFNPAGLNYIAENEISFMHSFWFQKINYSYLAYARPLPFLKGKGGASITYVNAGSIERITSAGESEGYFSPYDLALSFSYARRIWGIDSGLSFKYIYQNIYDDSASAFACDLGLRRRIPEKNLEFGASISNLGSSIKINEHSHSLPILFRFGCGYNVSDNLTAVVQATIPADNKAIIHAGAEYIWKKGSHFPVSLRCGYKTNSALDSLSAFSFGFGLKRDNLSFDYATNPYGKLGLSHRISLSFKGF